MFLIEKCVPFRNGILVEGRTQAPGMRLTPGMQLIAEKDGQRVGLVRYVGLVHTRYSHSVTNPPTQLSVAFAGDYRLLNGATLQELKPSPSNPAE